MDESHINHHANGRLGESEALLPPASSTAEAEAETTIHNAQNVERLEPAVHGQHVNWASAYILIVSRMLGSGVFASPGVVTRSAGSIGLSLSVWVFGAFMAACGASISLEYGCMLPRSGGDKVYLEYVYRRPRFLASTLITVKTILQTATANNCIVFGEYFVHALPIEPNETRRKLSALGLLLFTGILHGFFIRPGILVQNVLGWLKIAIMIFTALTSLYVLARGLAGSDRQHSQRPAEMNHENVWTTMWKGSHWTWDLVSLALFRVYYAYAGLDNANMVLNEVQNPVGMLKRVVPCSLISVTVLYVLINSAFFLVIPLDIIKEKGEMAATEFFERIMGQNIGSTIVPFLIAFSVAGNVMVAVFSLVRMYLVVLVSSRSEADETRTVKVESRNSSTGISSTCVRLFASRRGRCDHMSGCSIHSPTSIFQHLCIAT